MPNAANSCRVAILGGGPAGCATAIALARQGVDGVVLIEAGDYSRQRVGESLPPDARELLERLGLWQSFLRQGHAPSLGSCSLWGSDDPGYNDFISNAQGGGWHLDRRRFERWLADQAQALGVELRLHTRLASVDADAGGFRLQLRDPEQVEQLRADYLIDASGPQARLARLLGARSVELDQLICVYGFFERPPEVTASQLTLLEAVEYGWWYRASLPDGQLCIALACDRPGLRQLRASEWRCWLNLLAETRYSASNLAGHGFCPERMLTSPAASRQLDRVSGRRWLAVGDAATSFDPLTARGLHKALEDGLNAANAIVGWLHENDEPARYYSQLLTQRYQHYRQARQYLYSQEQRWPHSSFWRTRHARA